MSVIIGIDPHKALHAACAIDRTRESSWPSCRCARARVSSTSCSRGRRRSSVGRGRSSPPAGSAICSPSSSSRAASTSSMCRRRCRRGCGCWARDGRTRTTPTTPARSRSRRCGHRRWRSVRVEDHVSVLRLLAKAQLDIVARPEPRVQSAARAGARVGAGRDPQGNRCQHRPNQLLAGIEPVNAAQRQRLELAHETARRDPRPRRQAEAHPRRRITEAVTASGTTLTEIFGVGPIIAAMVIGYTGDVARFPTAGHYAAYNGTAPIEFSSSGRTVHRLSRRGNRTLNHAIHMIAVTQIRNPGSEGRAYYDTQARRRPHPTRSDALVEASHQRPRLPPPPRRRSRPIGPGGQSGNDSHIQRGRRNPGTRHFGISHSRTQTRTLRPTGDRRHRVHPARPHKPLEPAS